MPAAPVSCPFCNAVVPVPELVPESGRIRCPRCGDSFPLKGATTATAAGETLDQELLRHRESREVRAKRSVRRAAIIAIAFGILGLGVGWAISRSRDRPGPSPVKNVESKTIVSPVEIEGLAYLPKGTDSVIALQLHAYLESLPPGDQSQPRNALLRLGLPEDLLAGIERILGIPFDQIDQLVVGLKLGGGVISGQPVIVVRTRSTFVAEDLARRRKASADKRDGRTYFRTNASNVFGERFSWWAPNDHTLLIALQPEILDEIPAEGQRGQLAPNLVSLATDLLPKDTTCWAVLESDSWESLVGLAMFASKKNEALQSLLETVGYLKSATISVRVEDEPILTVWLDLKSEKSAEELRTYLNRRFAEDGGAFTVGGAGNRVMVRAPSSSGGLATALQRALPERKK